MIREIFCKESISGEHTLVGRASASAGIAGQRNNEAVLGEALSRKLQKASEGQVWRHVFPLEADLQSWQLCACR